MRGPQVREDVSNRVRRIVYKSCLSYNKPELFQLIILNCISVYLVILLLTASCGRLF